MSRLGKFSSLGNRLYSGDTAVEVIGHRKRWFASFGVVLLLAAIGLGVRGLHFSVDFTGGTVLTVPTQTLSTADATSVAVANGVSAPVVQEETITTGGAGRQITVTTTTIGLTTENNLKNALAKAADVNTDKINVQDVGASWGHEVSKDAFEALLVFLVLVTLYLAVFFEWQMAVAALVSLLNVVVITVGVYAWSGLQVSPATVTGFLTILGYAIYDAVVVFDKIKENRRLYVDTDRMGYERAANLAVNQTLMRSLNTSLIAVIPVVALMVGGVLSQAAVLQDIALALFVGIAAGTISSILLAAPLLVWIKERNPAVRAHEARIAARSQKEAARAAAADNAAAEAPSSVSVGGPSIVVSAAGQAPSSRVVQPRGTQRSQPQRKKKR
ncbi:protein translocase subunit SecF [Actinospica durhamensis]|uniref:Protein-export membrane protein SecF n=1 Tax=Actinospica durhamensis TaxID=1508375 RepID=A0A941EK40_9ACTN|nr:protein translocase subunit SecF [Actinospica durhamensis]MBR7832671.1 protein translocase subunit SecF [Actinospica durhamensis]